MSPKDLELAPPATADDEAAPCRVLAGSANAMPRDIERGMAAGFADYLTKPLQMGHFLQVVDARLDTAGEQDQS